MHIREKSSTLYLHICYILLSSQKYDMLLKVLFATSAEKTGIKDSSLISVVILIFVKFVLVVGLFSYLSRSGPNR